MYKWSLIVLQLKGKKLGSGTKQKTKTVTETKTSNGEGKRQNLLKITTKPMGDKKPIVRVSVKTP
jgi:hypothetical protein